MKRRYPEIVYTDSVKQTQEHYGTRRQGEKMEGMDWPDARFSEREAEFIAARDSFYMATVGDTGWPYVQYRGGPPGFLKVLDETTLAYADFRGNLQYISTGNLRHDDRVALFLMDYPNKKRLKIAARTEVFDIDQRPDLSQQLVVPGYKAKIERAFVFHVEAFDWNCPQHITPRLSEQEWAPIAQDYETQIGALKREIEHLRNAQTDIAV
jgi:predicted pyridoxine 5'-phosphate oxidase superfamily flavin-nucleotide-binding protein